MAGHLDNLFDCRGALAADHAPVPLSWDKHLRVDIHCHMHSVSAEGLAKPFFDPKREPLIRFASPETRAVNVAQLAGVREAMISVDARLEVMDKSGIDVQVLSPSPGQYYYWAEPDLGEATARAVNDEIAETVAGNPDRFAGLGTVPLQHPELAVREMERLHRDLGLKGIEIGTNVNGGELSDATLRPVFATAEELGLLLFMHPLGFTEGQRMANHYLINIIGNPLESTIALSHLIFDGVLDAHPGLKLCVAHGGGYLPGYAGRMDHAHAVRTDCQACIAHRPSEYLRRIYVDALVYSADELQRLVEAQGIDRVMLGTDYPYDMAEFDPLGHIAAAGLDEPDAARVLGRNAAELIGLDYEDLAARHSRRRKTLPTKEATQ